MPPRLLFEANRGDTFCAATGIHENGVRNWRHLGEDICSFLPPPFSVAKDGQLVPFGKEEEDRIQEMGNRIEETRT